MNIYLIGDSRAQNNWGCRATTYALISMIGESGGEVVGQFRTHSRDVRGLMTGRANEYQFKYPGLERVLITARKLRNRAKAVLGPRELRLNSHSDFLRMLDLAVSGQAWQAEVEGMKQADIVVANGEGAIYGRQKKGFELLFLCALAKRLGKPSILVNHTADLSDPEMREIAEFVYPQLDDVVFREPVSAREASAVMSPREDWEAADAAYSHNLLSEEDWAEYLGRAGALSVWPYVADSIARSRRYVCITGTSSYFRGEQRSLPPIDSYERLIKRISDLGMDVLLIAPDTTDEIFLGMLARKYQLPLLPANTPLPIATNILSRAVCLVGGRWHPGVLASIGGTPSITFTANTRKTQGLIEQLDLGTNVFDAFGFGDHLDDIVARVQAYAEGDSHRSDIRARAKRLSRLSRRNVRYLQRWKP